MHVNEFLNVMCTFNDRAKIVFIWFIVILVNEKIKKHKRIRALEIIRIFLLQKYMNEYKRM